MHGGVPPGRDNEPAYSWDGDDQRSMVEYNVDTESSGDLDSPCDFQQKHAGIPMVNSDDEERRSLCSPPLTSRMERIILLCLRGTVPIVVGLALLDCVGLTNEASTLLDVGCPSKSEYGFSVVADCFPPRSVDAARNQLKGISLGTE